MTPEQVKALLDRTKKLGETDEMFKRDYDFYTIAVGTGLRLSEVAHLEKGDILPERVMVTRRKKKTLHPTPIDVMPHVHEILKRRAAAVEEGYIFPGRAKPCIIHRQSKKDGPREEQVCIGGHCSLRSIQEALRLALEALDLYLYGRGIHTMRHVAITNVYNVTKDLRLAQVFAGHSSSTITERYAHLCDVRETLAKLPVMA